MGPMLGFDVETTDANPEEARIAQFALAKVNAADRSSDSRAELVNPGVPMPAEASAINGLTTEMLADAMPIDAAMAIVATALWEAIEGGWPVVAYNARYDLTVADREFRRLGVDSPVADPRLRVIDPRQLDLWLWRYREGKRTLTHVCEVYNAKLEGAHDAAFDAIAAARLAYRMGQSGGVMLEYPYDEVQAQRAEWERIRHSLDLLHEAQVGWAAADAARFEKFLIEKKGDTDAVVDRQWPFIPFGERAPGATEYELRSRLRRQAEAAAAAAQETLVEHALASPALKRASDLVTPEELEAAKAQLFSTEAVDRAAARRREADA